MRTWGSATQDPPPGGHLGKDGHRAPVPEWKGHRHYDPVRLASGPPRHRVRGQPGRPQPLVRGRGREHSGPTSHASGRQPPASPSLRAVGVLPQQRGPPPGPGAPGTASLRRSSRVPTPHSEPTLPALPLGPGVSGEESAPGTWGGVPVTGPTCGDRRVERRLHVSRGQTGRQRRDRYSGKHRGDPWSPCRVVTQGWPCWPHRERFVLRAGSRGDENKQERGWRGTQHGSQGTCEGCSPYGGRHRPGVTDGGTRTRLSNDTY